ncbi:ubl carboxyl-terminal hydrolase 18 [Mugil cephalus]|uniref:ubl carboxyl-terminal hydrolase 18 n=1 Tax=Mugil cephalus TaxID=48193 RepID=UPI001FB74D61|nr:ubl carboxyl-terminal hydrolase 18 [Mugil cephalus]
MSSFRRLLLVFSSKCGDHSHVGMRGLPNEHLSCCANTLLQTLSATWELADLLEKWEPAGVQSEGGNVPLQLKRLLASMRSDDPQPASNRDFLRCLHRNRIQLSVQHDADEVFLSILNFMQQQMDNKALADEIQNLYRISVETQLQCLYCTSIQTHGSFLLSLPLHIKEDHNSLEGCMKSFFEQQELKDMNSCYCTKCECKTPSKQGVKLLSLPPILSIQLKRYRNMRGSTRKLDCKVTFPESFNFSEMVPEAFSAGFAQDDCRYTLYAVVVHAGYAAFGHYTAYVHNAVKNCWYYADDCSVQPTSWEKVRKTYGGRDGGTAYMLMYRRGSREDRQQPDFSG